VGAVTIAKSNFAAAGWLQMILFGQSNLTRIFHLCDQSGLAKIKLAAN
jgi:hypothetical protein